MGAAAITERNRRGRKGFRTEAWESSLFNGWSEKRTDIGEHRGAGRLGKKWKNIVT